MSGSLRARARRAAPAVGLALFTVFAAGTRCIGLDHFLPQLSEPDACLVGATEFLWNGGDPKAAPRSFFWYDSLLPQALALTPAPWSSSDRAAPRSLAIELAAASEPVLRVRRLVALLAVCIVPATFLLARRFLGRWEALFAAGWIATSFLHLQLSTQARPHAAQATLSLVAVLAALRLRRRPSWGSYLAAGALAALALGCLQNGVFVLGPLVVAHLLRERGAGEGRWTRLASALAPCAFSLLWFGPAFNEPQDDTRLEYPPYGRRDSDPILLPGESYVEPVAVREGALALGPQRLRLEWFDGSGFGRMLAFLAWNDPLLLAFGASGLAVLAIAGRRRARAAGGLRGLLADPRARDLAVAAAYALAFVLVHGVYARIWSRFLLPLLPYLACLAAFGASSLLVVVARRARSPSARALCAGAGAAALLALPAAACLQRARLQSRPDTLEQAASWLAAHVEPEEERILVEQSLSLPLFSSRVSLASQLEQRTAQYARWLCYQDLFLESPPVREAFDFYMLPQKRDLWLRLATMRGAREVLRECEVQYAVLELSRRTASQRSLANLRSAIAESGRLVASFGPPASEAERLPWSIDFQDGSWSWWRTLRTEHLGPRLELYRIDRDGDPP